MRVSIKELRTREGGLSKDPKSVECYLEVVDGYGMAWDVDVDTVNVAPNRMKALQTLEDCRLDQVFADWMTIRGYQVKGIGGPMIRQVWAVTPLGPTRGKEAKQ